MYEGPDRRDSKRGEQRGRRLAATAATVPLAAPVTVIIVFYIKEKYSVHLDDSIIIAISSIVGSLLTGVAICYNDLRSYTTALFLQRRNEDPRQVKRNGNT